jgi:ribosomal protein S18 acetylase RimI-like enzyme
LGVARAYRRQGLARALLASALAPIHERGVQHVMAEVDDSNTAGLALIRGIGAVETGSSVVLLRRATPAREDQ